MPSWLEEKIQIPLWSLILLITIFFVCALLLFKTCHPSPSDNILQQDSTTHIVHNSSDTSQNHSIIADTTIKQKPIISNIVVPQLDTNNIHLRKQNWKDSCSPVILNQTFPRRDGGYTSIYFVVSCRNGKLDTISIYNSPIHKDTITTDSFIYVYKSDSIAIKRVTDSIYTSVTKTVKQNPTVLALAGFGSYDPFFTHNINLGLAGTLNLNQNWSIIATPQLSFTPLNGLNLSNILQIDVGLQYTFLNLVQK